MNKRGFYFQRKFWMFFNFYLKPFLSVRGFSFFNIMKTQLSKDERYILGKKKNTNESRLPLKSRFDSKYWTPHFRTISDEIFSIFNTSLLLLPLPTSMY